MEKIYGWLFGESKWQQKKKLKKLLICTVILAVIAFLLLFDGSTGPTVMAGVILLMWGWNFVKATATSVGRIIGFIGSDIAILIISLILWLSLGIFGGGITLVLGIIRFIQLRDE